RRGGWAAAGLLRAAARLLRAAAAGGLLRLLRQRGLVPDRSPSMTMIHSNRIIALAVAALRTQPALALAQSAPTPGAEARVEQRSRELHAELQITAAEEPQWQQSVQIMRDNSREMDQALTQRG